MQLLDETERRVGIRVVQVHGDDGDLRHASITGVTEGGQPVRIGVCQGRRQVGGVWMRDGEKRLQIVGRVGRIGEGSDIVVGIIGLVEQGQVLWWVGFEELESGGDFCGIHYLVNLCGIEGGGGRCWSGAGVVGFGRVESAERKANYFRGFGQQRFDCTLVWGKVFDLLQSLTPLAVRLSQVVCGQPAFLGAPVLKTVFRNPALHFPPPDPLGVAMLEGCCDIPEAIETGVDVVFEVLLEYDSLPFTASDSEPPPDPLSQPGI